MPYRRIIAMPGSALVACAFLLSGAGSAAPAENRDPLPTSYRLSFEISPEAKTLKGFAEIGLRLPARTRTIDLNGRDLAVSSVELISRGRRVSGSYVETDARGNARITLASDVDAGPALLRIRYSAPVGSDAEGVYHAQVGGRWYLWSQFEPSNARRAFPGFDQPGFKTPFTISITTGAGEGVVSNAPETSATPDKDLVRHVFAQTKPLPTYLVTMAVGPFARRTSQIGADAVRRPPLALGIWVTQPNRDRVELAQSETGPILKLTEEYFGRAYPFEKLDEIASPLMTGGMENAGAIVYEDGVFLPDAMPSVSEQQAFGMTVAHELAHQWFGDLVTPKTWNDVWLNESFANWMGYRTADRWRPGLKVGVSLVAEGIDAMRSDELSSSHAIHPTAAGAAPAFDPIVYGKGGQVLAMIAAYLGDETFRSGLRLHFARHAYGNADTEDFFQSLASAAGDPAIVAALRSFVDQPGVPVIRFERMGPGYRLHQQRYRPIGASLPDENWKVPMCLRTEKERSCVMVDADRDVMLRGGLVTPNAGGAGYYRYSLPDDEWRTVLAGVDRLSAAEALTTIDSLWADFAAGRASPHLLLLGAQVMTHHPFSGAQVESGRRLERLRQQGFVPDRAVADYRTRLTNLYGPLLDRLGFEPRAHFYATEDPDRQQQRARLVRLLSEEARVPQVQSKLDAAASASLNGDRAALADEYLIDGYGAWINADAPRRLPQLFERLVKTTDPSVRETMAFALGQGRDEVGGAWIASHLSDSRLTLADRIPMLRGLADEPASRTAALVWVSQNYDLLLKGAASWWRSVVPAIFDKACSDEDLATLAERLGPHVVGEATAKASLDQTLEKVRNCSALKKVTGPAFAKAIESGT